MSLRLRLLIATALTMLSALTVVDVSTYVLVRNAQVGQVDAAIDRAHTPIEQLASSQNRRDWRAIPAVAPGFYVAILDDGAIEFISTPTEAGRDAQELASIGAIDTSIRTQTVRAVDGDKVRVRVDRLDDDYSLVVGQSLREVSETTSTLLTVLLGASAAAIVLAMLLAWWLVTTGLLPLRRVQARAAAITDHGLDDQRVPGASETTEVGQLAASLNKMLDRLHATSTEREQTLVELTASESRMRRFVADASHELRTPIAATAAYAELFEQGARDRPEDLDRAMSGIRNETGRMAELVDDLLTLARLDENRQPATDTVDLTEVVLTAIDAARTVDPGRTITPRISEVVSVVGDRLRLRQVVDNLLANVRAHTPADAACEVRLAATSDGVELVVSDNGPGVANEALPHLFDRFYRIDDARTRATGGSGLGLSIVAAIVRSSGGFIEANANDPTGLKISVRLPIAPPGETETETDVDDDDDVADLSPEPVGE